MAFCTGCGTQIDDKAKFCPSCGTPAGVAPTATPETYVGSTGTAASPAVSAAPAFPPRAPAAGGIQPVPAPKGGGGVVKVIIIVLVIIVGLGMLAAAGVFWAGYKLRKAIKVEQQGDSATVSTPWGKVTSNQDAATVAKELGVEVYPGARSLAGASSVSFGGSTVGNAEFETDDAIDKVGKFYTLHYPKSTVNTADENDQTIVASTSKGMVTIVLERQGSGTKITLSRVGGNGAQRGSNETQ